MAYHLGNIKDMEDFKQKIQKQKKLKNKTLKAVKPYLPSADILTICKSQFEFNNPSEVVRPFFTKSKISEKEGKFLSNQIDEKVFSPQIQEAKVVEIKPKKLTPRQIQMERPLFGCEHEKFEFLMSNGCTSSEDRTWLRNYMMSDEYINIYADYEQRLKGETTLLPVTPFSASNQAGGEC